MNTFMNREQPDSPRVVVQPLVHGRLELRRPLQRLLPLQLRLLGQRARLLGLDVLVGREGAVLLEAPGLLLVLEGVQLSLGARGGGVVWKDRGRGLVVAVLDGHGRKEGLKNKSQKKKMKKKMQKRIHDHNKHNKKKRRTFCAMRLSKSSLCRRSSLVAAMRSRSMRSAGRGVEGMRGDEMRGVG